MTFKRVDGLTSGGTSYQGLIKAKYQELVAMFGQPDGPSGDGKSQASWTLEVAGSVIVKIYDYKEDQEPRSLMLWHVGGKTKDAVQLLNIIVKEFKKNEKSR